MYGSLHRIRPGAGEWAGAEPLSGMPWQSWFPPFLPRSSWSSYSPRQPARQLNSWSGRGSSARRSGSWTGWCLAGSGSRPAPRVPPGQPTHGGDARESADIAVIDESILQGRGGAEW